MYGTGTGVEKKGDFLGKKKKGSEFSTEEAIPDPDEPVSGSERPSRAIDPQEQEKRRAPGNTRTQH